MSIAGKAVRGAAWNLTAGVGSRIIALIGTMILTRFIAPGEYGEISAANIAVASAMMLANCSVGQSIMARRVGPDVCFHAFVLHMTTGIVALIPVLVFAPGLGGFLDAPDMARFVPGFCAAALLELLAHVPSRVLVRDMRFRVVALTRGIAELVFVAVSLSLAPYIQGYAIVVGNIVRWGIIATVFIVTLDRREWFVPQRLRWPVFKDLLGFGLPLSAGYLAEFASLKWDKLLFSRYFGTSLLGQYNLAYNLADTPTTNVAEHIGDVLLPSFTQMEQEQRKNALVRSASIMALLVFPLSVGLASVAPTLVAALFDPRWVEIAPMLMILSSMSVVRPMSWTLHAFLQAQQRPRTIMLLGFFGLGAMLLLLALLAPFGPLWACVAVGLASAAHTGVMLWAVHRADGVHAMRFIVGALPPLLACAPMFAAVTGLRLLLRHLGIDASAWSLALEIVTGGAIYVGAALVLARTVIDDVVGLVRAAMKKRQAG